MGSKKTRRRHTRRDRRKAKMSGYRRMGKKPGRVGHGSALPIEHQGNRGESWVTRLANELLRRKKQPPMAHVAIPEHLLTEVLALMRKYPPLETTRRGETLYVLGCAECGEEREHAEACHYRVTRDALAHFTETSS